MADPDASNESALQFPCEFPIKIMGRDEPAFHTATRTILERHLGTLDAGALREARSRNATFVSITATITATSQQQLDRIYADLSDHDDILVAL